MENKNEKKDNSKKKNSVILVIIMLSITLLIGLSFGYLIRNYVIKKVTDVNINSVDKESLQFFIGPKINFVISPDNVGNGQGNKSGNTFAEARLIANNERELLTKKYFVYLNIIKNNFEYALSPEKAELLLTIKNPSGELLTQLPDGTNIKTVTDGKGGEIKGFDITDKSGLLTIAEDYTITSSSATDITNQKWEMTITFINYNENQERNLNKTFNGEFVIQEGKVASKLTDICKKSDLLSTCIKNYEDHSRPNISGLYHHNGTILGTINDKEEILDANDNSYRFAGANPNNYVKFNNEDYRIIGLFNEGVKLIKDTNITLGDEAFSDAWDTNGGNNWEASSLYNYLNTTYLDSLGQNANKIATISWNVGGNTIENIEYTTPAIAYKNEITTPNANTKVNAKIGLIYVNDYLYSVPSQYWSNIIVDKNGKYDEETILWLGNDYQKSKELNWLNNGNFIWTITPVSNSNNKVFSGYEGSITSEYSDIKGPNYQPGMGAMSTPQEIKPVFYLNPTIQYASGTGTKADPIILL